MQYLKQSTAKTLRFGPFVDDTDGKTAETGLTIAQADVRLSKNGGDFAQKNGAASATHDESGWYSLELNATDTNTLGPLTMFIQEAGALPVWRDFMVITANAYDSLCSTDYLKVDVEQIDGASTAAANLNSACDNYSATRGLAGTALPAAAADAAGGLPISDDGGLDMDAILEDTANLQGNQGAWATATSVTVSDKTGFSLAADQSAVTIGTINALASTAVTDIWSTDVLTESYAADGATATPAQLLYMLLSGLGEFAISGTTITCKKLDGSTTSMTFTLDSATTPTSRTRAS